MRQLFYALTGLVVLSLYFYNVPFHGAYERFRTRAGAAGAAVVPPRSVQRIPIKQRRKIMTHKILHIIAALFTALAAALVLPYFCKSSGSSFAHLYTDAVYSEILQDFIFSRYEIRQ